MTLIKSLLLGSAAGIVAVASAQAADLPTRKAAPVEYVRVCNVGGITGWVLPGSDTCVKLSGYITGQVTGGNLNTQYNWASTSIYSAVTGITFPTAFARSNPALLVQASTAQQNTTFFRNDMGWSTRANFGFDFASNTGYGPLIGHFDVNIDVGNGLDPLQYGTANIAYLNQGYLTWAGITAGKAPSFFSFIGGGDNWANIFSPDQRGFNEPMLLAYTASFGGGFSATLAAQSPGTEGASGGGTDMTGGYFNTNSGPNPGQFNATNITFGGQRWPDIVGALHVKQGWGEAQLSGVLHDVNVSDNVYNGQFGCGGVALAGCNGQENKMGWGIDAGVKVYLPSFGAGDDFVLTGAYTQNATWFSGIGDGMWSETRRDQWQRSADVCRRRLFQPADQQLGQADGLVNHGHFGAPLHAAVLCQSGRFGPRTQLEQPGRLHLGGGRGGSVPRRRERPRRTAVAAFAQLHHRRGPRLEPGHQPQLRPRVDVSGNPPGHPGRRHRNHLRFGQCGSPGLGGDDRGVRARRVAEQQQRFRRPLPRHPLLLIATRSVEANDPGAKAPGFFVVRGEPRGTQEFGVRANLRLHARRRRLKIASARAEARGETRPARVDSLFAPQ